MTFVELVCQDVTPEVVHIATDVHIERGVRICVTGCGLSVADSPALRPIAWTIWHQDTTCPACQTRSAHGLR